MGISDITRDGVLRTLAEYESMGADRFRALHGFGKSRGYRLVHDGRRYDSKAIVGVAHRHVDGRPLRAGEFSGGAATVVRVLERLGFTVEVPGAERDSGGTEADTDGPRVLVCPSYGSRESRRHWQDTLERTVDFTAPSLVDLLTEEQQARLLELHPDGRAQFWGARPRHDRAMQSVRAGDVALFTGANHVRAIGEVGAIFRNTGFADMLWPPQDGAESWHTVYSLRAFVPAMIPYRTLSELIGYADNYQYPGQLVLDGDKAWSVIEGLRITTRTALEEAGAVQPFVPDGAAAGPTPTREAELERQHTPTTVLERAAAHILYKREEQPLVAEFCGTLTDTLAGRYYCSAGVCDIYLQGPTGVELVEAKSRTGRSHVREALAQLLDYAPHSPRPADRLAALFPASLDEGRLELLHRYGVDCIHRTAPGVFRRLPAPAETVRVMRELWAPSRA